mmetsp:Transcript_83021/g.213918  ORF Transcript_83021/g.213918 Transcript_83021/m.213918 type:complete len:337 (-) Transcript_83021:504-1514(-)
MSFICGMSALMRVEKYASPKPKRANIRQAGMMRITQGLRTLRKSKKPISALRALPMMMFGVSPIMVAVPPMLPKSASEISIGLGATSIASHSEITTGARSSIVVTLSRKALRKQSNSISMTYNFHRLAPDASTTRTAHHSKAPVLESSEMITIMPKSSPRVPWSIQLMTFSMLGRRCSSAMTKRTQEAPTKAASVRWMTSVKIRPRTTNSKTAAIHTCALPTTPSADIRTSVDTIVGQFVSSISSTAPPLSSKSFRSNSCLADTPSCGSSPPALSRRPWCSASWLSCSASWLSWETCSFIRWLLSAIKRPPCTTCALSQYVPASVPFGRWHPPAVR